MQPVDTNAAHQGVGRALWFAALSLILVLIAPFLFALGRMPPLYPVVIAVILVAGLIIFVRGDRPLSGTKIAIYWLGLALSVGWCIGAFVYTLGLDLIGPKPPGRLVHLWYQRGGWASGLFIIGSALVLLLVRRRTPGVAELAIYGLGFAVAVLLLIFGLQESGVM